MDLGCYPLHALRTLTGAEPEIVEATAEQTGPAGIDTRMEAVLDFAGMRGEILCAMGADAPLAIDLELTGENGHVHMMNFVHPHRGCAITVDGRTESFGATEMSTYDHQLAHVMDVLAGRAEPLTGGEDALANMRAIDAIYRAAGMEVRG